MKFILAIIIGFSIGWYSRPQFNSTNLWKNIIIKNVICEIGIEFFKDKKYKIIKITDKSVTLLNEYNYSSNFMLDMKYKNNNYLWDWFTF